MRPALAVLALWGAYLFAFALLAHGLADILGVPTPAGALVLVAAGLLAWSEGR